MNIVYRYALRLGLVLLCLLAGMVNSRADTSNTGAGAANPVERLKDLTSGKVKLPEDDGRPTTLSGPTTTSDPMHPDAPSPLFTDATTQKAYLDALQEYYRYRSAGLEHRREVFKWQLFSAKIIFAVVLVLVAAGIYFAAVQFYAGLRRQGPDSDGTERPVTEISASPEGIKVSSPVLGVIILVISLAFFYLYLVYVYPIEDIF